VLLFTAFEEGEVVLEDGLRGDGGSAGLHIFFYVFHLILDAVFVLELSFGLQVLENLEYDLSLLL